MDSHYLSLLEGAGGVRRERLPGGLGQTQLAAGGSNESGGVVRNVCANCAGEGEFSWGKSIFSLTAFLRNLIEGQLLSQKQDFRAEGCARAEQETEEKKPVHDQIGDQVKQRIQ